MFSSGRRDRLDVPIQIILATLASVLLFWGLTEKYLWQDEAATAVLAVRMLKFGRPVAYDGVNLMTTDMFYLDGQMIASQSGPPQAALDFHARMGEFKPDMTWKWQPWGLFAVAALSFKTLGQTTLAARLPFALAGLASVLLLFHLVRRYARSLPVAVLSALFLLCNPYWILHVRQCRYYSISSLFLVLTLLGYCRWQQLGKGGTVAFLAAAWCWFQVDYGTVWPALAVLFLDSFLAGRQPWKRTLATGGVLACMIAPFFFYFELWGRALDRDGVWTERFTSNLFNMNEYILPGVVFVAAAVLLKWRWRTIDPGERRLVAVSLGVILAMALWVPTVTGRSHLRYAIIAVPAAAILIGWVVVRMCESRPWLIGPVAALLIVTPWASLPLHVLASPPEWYTPSPWFRAELSVLQTGVFGHRPDPNRLVIEWLQKNAAPSDEILINYEDLPLMFYLPNPIRGGISAFRVTDDAKRPPRFAVLRHSVQFTHWPIFEREMGRYQWELAPLKAPDVRWGNNPDPRGQEEDASKARDLYIARRIGP